MHNSLRPMPQDWLPMPIIPLGAGMVIVETGTADGPNGNVVGLLNYHGLNDDINRMDPKPAPEDCMAMMGDDPRPRASIVFETVEAIDMMMEQLALIKEQMTKEIAGA